MVAFTLAEVLITIAIIGFVAALTIPLLISNFEKNITVHKLKVAYQTFSQIIEKAKLDNDGELPVNGIEFTFWAHSDVFSQRYIEPYLNGTNKYSLQKNFEILSKGKKENFMLLRYVSGRAPVCIPKGFCYWVVYYNFTSPNLILYVDLDGPGGKNIAGRDVFAFDLVLNETKDSVVGLSLPDKSWSREDLLRSCTDSSTYRRKGTGQKYFNGLDCSTLIFRDGWEISNDYYW